MTFDYSVYYRQNCIVPLLLSIFSFALFAITLFGVLKQKNTRSLKKNLLSISLLCVFAFLVTINLIPLFRGGIFLLVEKEKDQIQIFGTIEETIELDFLTGSKYDVENNQGNGEAIVVDGEIYYLVSYGDFDIGSDVKLSVLPRSGFVLKIEQME